MKPHFHFITLFPETVSVWLSSSILGRALKQGLFSFTPHQLRDFAVGPHRSVDDAAYGGGGGMVLRLEPLVAAVESIWEKVGKENATTIYFTPVGKKLNQAVINEFRAKNFEHIILICGHYEGIDERFLEGWVDHQISLGDFVLTGGELPAVAFTDALIRQYDGVLGNEVGYQQESFSIGHPLTLLEYPHYTRPQEFRGQKVPDVLLSGNHQNISKWRLEQAQTRTRLQRPDLLPEE